MRLLRFILGLTLALPALPAWSCEAGQADPAAKITATHHRATNNTANSATEAPGEHGHAHHPQRADAHHGHDQSSLGKLAPMESGDKADHDCCPAHDLSSSCSTTPGCGQGMGVSLTAVSANLLVLPEMKAHELDRLTAALLPSHALPPFRPPLN